ncbi:FAD-dependent oxidoreductase [Bradyrhizobium betae]|uniref:FAD-dependent oxidoreductase n=2 Tax=Bradyrhizobium betae TaxID=244734 RepID=A0A5P6PG71_9BRAD|nr:FAD-dependent oxidoreductase [Bradyrhizobium betae]
MVNAAEITADAIVIGGGFYGCETALELKRLGLERVVIAEREPDILRRASFVNQARVHNGYHYPRAPATALRSRRNFERFVADYAGEVMHDLEKYYAIARGSRVSADQFEAFCQRIGAPIQLASHDVVQLFSPGSIERVFRVRELAFDAGKLAARLRNELNAARIDLRLGTAARIRTFDDRGVDVLVGDTTERARFVFNCTYSELPFVGIEVKSAIKRELTEMALIAPPPQLRGRGFTVMDGPFFSVMPFPPTGLHALSHVRYTPHEAAQGSARLRPVKSNAVAMIRDASRYMPCLAHAEVRETMFEIKAVLMQTEDSDARPILVERNDDEGRIFSILGAKIDNIYELRDFLRGRTWN